MGREESLGLALKATDSLQVDASERPTGGANTLAQNITIFHFFSPFCQGVLRGEEEI